LHLGGRSTEPAGWRRRSYQLINQSIVAEFAKPFVWMVAFEAAPHGRWIEDCERRVRSFLGLVEAA
jgi:hypothetical protein